MGWSVKKILTTPETLSQHYHSFQDDLICDIKQISAQFYSVHNKQLDIDEIWTARKIKTYIKAQKANTQSQKEAAA